YWEAQVAEATEERDREEEIEERGNGDGRAAEARDDRKARGFKGWLRKVFGGKDKERDDGRRPPV
ncbi:MAG TPA: hypothetical protein VJ885_11080, partial [Thermoanaerobaculia bacterium]|nr:hypothetical protein [Thermoanaerobaculia bacterium]